MVPFTIMFVKTNMKNKSFDVISMDCAAEVSTDVNMLKFRGFLLVN